MPDWRRKRFPAGLRAMRLEPRLGDGSSLRSALRTTDRTLYSVLAAPDSKFGVCEQVWCQLCWWCIVGNSQRRC